MKSPMTTPANPSRRYILIEPGNPTYRMKDGESAENYADRMADFGVERVCYQCKSSRPYKSLTCPRCMTGLHLLRKQANGGEPGPEFSESLFQEMLR